MSERGQSAEKDLIVNPPLPEWTKAEGFTRGPVPGLTHPCGCHLRRPDYEAILCPEHLAALNEDRRTPPAQPGVDQ